MIHISFKDIVENGKPHDTGNLDSTLMAYKGTIGMLAERYRFLLSSEHLDEADKIAFRQISTRNPDPLGAKFLMSEDNLKTSLLPLSMLL